ncbi:ThuA domain-containing protein [Stratiformator vulcanicus]|uniref:Trehalose utilization n=1 Tax=Stratiformator vulcanicus TaxID=2527980 RepID=A0A517R0Z6_9PLAN|nr:ThuA domain-containing protein [Stratiformator vulcanicus]QDT37569.1 Trehalose utilization [Stratiformator vulcanicus]
MSEPTRVLIWNEYRHERERQEVRDIYPDGIHGQIAGGIASDDLDIRTATLDEPEQGLSEEVLDWADVVVWWAHLAHLEVEEEIVQRVHQRVLSGMGFVALHSTHDSKIFKRLLGTSCSLKWREANEAEILWNLQPSHPICRGIGERIELDHEEMYGERFDVPEPEELLFLSWFQGGEVFRSGCTWRRGHGRIVYFRPGHETHPTYYNESVLRVIGNAVRWAKRTMNLPTECTNPDPVRSIT